MAFEFLDFLMAASIMVGVIVIGASDVFFFFRVLKVLLNSLVGRVVEFGVNWRFKQLAIFFGLLYAFPLKEML